VVPTNYNYGKEMVSEVVWVEKEGKVFGSSYWSL